MEPNERRWKEQLALYGGDFRRWPEHLSDDQQAAVRALPEYSEACRIDNGLNTVSWPTPSDGLRARTMQRIAEISAAMPPAAAPVLILFLRRPALLLSVLALVLGLGFTSGAKMTRAVHQHSEYNLLSLGPSYALNPAGNHRHD